MRYKVVYSTKFKKDRKRYQHDMAKMKALFTVFLNHVNFSQFRYL